MMNADKQAPDSKSMSPIWKAASMRPGIGLKPQHYQDILDTRPDIGWVEIHPENYMCAGGPPHRYLSAISELYPLSLHSVGMSLGSVQEPHIEHLNSLRTLIDRYDPFLVSDHVSWSRGPAQFHSDLLPLPYTEEALEVLIHNTGIAQDTLGRQILMENPSTYIEFDHMDMGEPEFLNTLVERSGCGLLMDVNNVHVCAQNHGFDAYHYLSAISWDAVQEIHLAGHAIEKRDGHAICIDDHGSDIIDDVWALYEFALGKTGPVPVLIERDTNIPPLANLMNEVEKAAQHLQDAQEKW